MEMMKRYKIIKIKLVAHCDAVPEYELHHVFIQEQVELALEENIGYVLVSTFIHDKHLFLIFRKLSLKEY
jgi:hypothetical protein